MDINSPHIVAQSVPQLRNAVPVDQDCKDYLYCGMPYLVPVLTMIWKTHWLHGVAPKIETPISMRVQTRIKTPDGERVFLNVEGEWNFRCSNVVSLEMVFVFQWITAFRTESYWGDGCASARGRIDAVEFQWYAAAGWTVVEWKEYVFYLLCVWADTGTFAVFNGFQSKCWSLCINSVSWQQKIFLSSICVSLNKTY